MNSEIINLDRFKYDNKLPSGTQSNIFIEILRTFVVVFSFQEAAVKEDEEEISDKGSDSEEEETNRDSQSEKEDGSDRDSDREQDEKQSKDDEAVRLIGLNNWNYTSDDSFVIIYLLVSLLLVYFIILYYFGRIFLRDSGQKYKEKQSLTRYKSYFLKQLKV